MKSSKLKLLICDDERNTRDALARFFRTRFDVTTAEDGITGINLLQRNNYDLILTDMKMPGADGLCVLDAALKNDPKPTCIVFTAYGSIATAVTAVKRGAFDFVTKPVNLDQLEIVIDRALESRKLKEENRQLKQKLGTETDLSNIIAKSKVMQEIMETVKQVAPTRSTILLSGESGTGKEVIAKAIHKISCRNGAFIPIHCAALPANLLESELFGYEKGAFTGAVDQKPGRFELADNGTLFLDEIGEIDPQVQVKLLRVLETRSFERIGGIESLETSARLISATNRDLKTMVENGDFREDLFYRLDVVNIKLPPLRDRIEDIPILVKHFIDEFAADNIKNIRGISEGALAALCAYSWPGNIRELRNCIERMIVLCRGNSLEIDNVPFNILNQKGSVAGYRPKFMVKNTSTAPQQGTSLDLDQNEKLLIIKALEECGGNRTKAADKLGISRRTLHRRLKEYNL
ncbi:MAG: sigma-54-dependent Fis family transcriptional regulator [Lentisphaerae bacterium]|nr:sigma-54-dependent Fis family transcriptional regulator [Lentisphaerota bacterium]MCP4101520.1 sigma-54-dependent Fis family transcriptional regulator [Lentisphaerota bacterium]